jgi:hypothetical protein
MARLVPTCSGVMPILCHSAALGFSITQPRDLKFRRMLHGTMRWTNGDEANRRPYVVGGSAKSVASVV